ncbi:MAG: hypothetical protein ACW97A_03765 [Candidatus Thorarchaeota archaeon]
MIVQSVRRKAHGTWNWMLDPELEKLAGLNRQKLVEEFAEKYANLAERVRRVPIAEAERISDEMSCPLQVALVAYLINMDGLLSIKEAVSLLANELQRRSTIDENVPNLPGNVQEFALGEGRWILYIYGSFIRNLELKVREISNLEIVLDEFDLPVEKAISVLQVRDKLAETFIVPVVQKWLDEHLKSTPEDLLMVIGPAITKWKRETLRGKFVQLRRRNQALFRKLRESIAPASDSATVESIVKRIDNLVESLGNDLDKMSVTATAHFLLHITPRSTGRGDKSPYVDFGVGSTRGNRTEPDMDSPFDFLERDVRLAKRRTAEDRVAYLKERIERVVRVLSYQGNDQLESVEKSIVELGERLNLQDIPVKEITDSAEAQILATPLDERSSVVVNLIFDFVNTYAYGGESQ